MDWLQQVLRKCPHLEAVEVLGLSPKQQGGVLAAWEEAVQRRGGDARGHPAAAEGGGLRLALTEE